MKKRITALLCLLSILVALPCPVAFAEEAVSDWVLADTAPEGAQIVGRKWTYTEERRYDVSSPEEATSGSVLLGSEWTETGRGSANYASIPSGFDTGHWLYSNLNRGAYRASSNDSTKREVSNSWAGYVYWHWMYNCGGANGVSTRAILDYRGWGPENGYSYQYFGAFQSTNGNYASDRFYCNSRSILNYIIPERTSWADCQGSTRWFRFDYYRSSYVDYRKVYHYLETVTGETEDESTIPEGAGNVTEYVKYRIVVENCPTPRLSKPSDSSLRPGEKLEIFCDAAGAVIYYAVTVDNMLPDEYQLYAGPFEIPNAESFQVFVYATKTGMGESKRAVFHYKVAAEQSLPVVTTLEADHITDTSAVLHAEVESEAELLSLSFLYFEKNNSRSRKTVEAPEENQVMITGLTPGTEYRFQAIAMSDSGQSSGNVLSFKTNTTGKDEPASIELTPSYLVLAPGESRQLLATVLPSTAVSGIYWSSEDPEVAQVSQSGAVTGVSSGQTRICAKTVSGRLSAKCTVEVLKRPDVTGNHDFSELNMVMRSSLFNETGGFDVKYDAGGNAIMASAYLARWDGTVSEKTDPYPANGVVTNYNAQRETPADYHVQEILYLPWRSGPLDNDEIKKAVMTCGAVYTAFRVRDADFSEDGTAYYHAKQYAKDKGHSVAIVGWDDDFPASRFNTTPPGNGAFLCKNSWGKEWGEEGYFYISYYDVCLAQAACGDTNAVFYHLQAKNNFNKIYQYDILGPIARYGFTGKTGWYANVFPGKGEVLADAEVLKAVSFYTVSPSTEYELYIVRDYKGRSSLEQLGKPIKTGTIDYAGYHTLTLSEAERLAAGTRFAVVVKITDPGDRASVFVETPIQHFSSRARAGQDESYIREQDGFWTDLTTLEKLENTNVCLKAFTSADPDADLAAAADPAGGDDTVHTLEELMEAGLAFNPAYVEQAGLMEEEEEGPATGLLAPIVLPELSTSYNYAEGGRFPARYDLREEGFVTPVKDQGRLGSCWSFAAYASLESSVLRAASSEYAAVGGLNQAVGEKTVSLDMDAPALILGREGRVQLTAVIRPFGSEDEIIWSSSDNDVATVSSRGIVTACGVGSAVITVSTGDGGASASCTIIVSEPADAAAISLYNPAEDLPVGGVTLLDYNVYPSNARQTGLIWESDDPTVAVVDEYGMVTGVSGGAATITAYTKDRKISQSLRLNVGDGRGFHTSLVENALEKRDGAVKGSLTVQTENHGEEAQTCTFVLVFYTGGGKQVYSAVTDRKIAGKGKGEITWEVDLNVPADTAAYRVFTLRKEDCVPLAEKLTGTIS